LSNECNKKMPVMLETGSVPNHFVRGDIMPPSQLLLLN
jgi:hypothetical protein